MPDIDRPDRPGALRRRFVLAVLMMVTACARSGPESPAASTGPGVAPPQGRAAVVVAVLDGDSLEVETGGARLEVRMAGINAPERDECFGDAARSRTIDLVEGRTVVLVEGAGDDRDQYGRLLRYVYLEDGTLVNAVLVEEGYALATSESPATGLEDLEDAAFAASVGMWGREVCGPPAPGRAVIAGLEFDAAGPDEDNPNGEWVEVANPGPDAVRLEGWVIRDESSRHRYVFPPGATLAAGGAVLVLSGCGTDEEGVLHWCAGDPVWSNGGDTAYLLDPSGNLVDRYAY